MLMSELIEEHDAETGRLVKTLARALTKTGPVLHEGYCYSGRVKGHKHVLKKDIKRTRGAKISAKVEVPWGLLPELLVGGLDRPLDAILIGRFKGYAQALESGAATSERTEDLETLVDNLESLADDLRLLMRSRLMKEEAERLMDQGRRSGMLNDDAILGGQ
jgi:hypothetical protein